MKWKILLIAMLGGTGCTDELSGAEALGSVVRVVARDGTVEILVDRDGEVVSPLEVVLLKDNDALQYAKHTGRAVTTRLSKGRLPPDAIARVIKIDAEAGYYKLEGAAGRYYWVGVDDVRLKPHHESLDGVRKRRRAEREVEEHAAREKASRLVREIVEAESDDEAAAMIERLVALGAPAIGPIRIGMRETTRRRARMLRQALRTIARS